MPPPLLGPKPRAAANLSRVRRVPQSRASEGAFSSARRATLADVAAVARLTAQASDVRCAVASRERTAPEIAVRLLEDLEAGSVLYVAERQGLIVGFAQVTEIMVADGGHVIELRLFYVMPDLRRHGIGGQLLRLLVDDLRLALMPELRAWAPKGSGAASFLQSAGGRPLRDRWRVQGGVAVRGTVFGWRQSRVEPAAQMRAAHGRPGERTEGIRPSPAGRCRPG